MRYRPIYMLLLFFSLGQATEPILPPYYEFNISGYLENSKTQNKANYTLQLFGYSKENNTASNWIQCKGMNKSYERPYFLTDSTGYFSIRVNNQFYLDSIKVGIVNPDKMLFGESISISENSLTKIDRQYAEPNKSGCNSCSTEPISFVTEKYIYTNNSYKIKVGI